MKSEDSLIKQAINGDQTAFEALVEKYKAYVFAIVLNFISDNRQAENVAQEVFLQVYLALPQYRFEGFRTWIGTIAAHKAIDWKRKQQRITEKEKAVNIDRFWKESTPGDSLPDEQLIEKEEFERLRTLYNQLPEKYRVIVKKYYFLEESYLQIAQEEEIAVKTVESRLYRARQMLKKQWKEGV